jgi:glycosyltransferase involved in cell wall biosynthesis
MTISVLGLSLYGPLAASTRYRLMQYVPGLRAQGIDLDVRSLLGDRYVQTIFAGKKYALTDLLKDYMARAALLLQQRRYDLAIVNAELFPLLPGFIESRLLRIPYIYDFDDAFFLKYRMDRFQRVSFLLANKFDPIVARAAAVTAGNRHLQKFASARNHATHWLPTVVDTERYLSAPSNRAGIFTVGWIGSPSTSPYLALLAEPLERLGREGPVRLKVVGGHCPDIPSIDVVNIPWSEATEVDLINSFDVGVMPLTDDAWARGKCAFKLIQYMACAVPVVASPVGANVDVVNEASGLLADNADNWFNALRRLRDDAALRQRLGSAARATVEQSYSLRSTLPIMERTIKAVAAGLG